MLLRGRDSLKSYWEEVFRGYLYTPVPIFALSIVFTMVFIYLIVEKYK